LFDDTTSISSSALTQCAALYRSHLPAAAAEVHWLAMRGEPPSEEEPEVWFGVTLPIIRYGAFAMALGLGKSGAGWLAQLASSPWFDGLALGNRDLKASDITSSRGTWNIGGDPIGLPHRVGLVTLAICDPGSVKLVVAERLVRTLMQTGRVMVTMPATSAGRILGQALRTEGAFIVTGSSDIRIHPVSAMLRVRRLRQPEVPVLTSSTARGLRDRGWVGLRCGAGHRRAKHAGRRC
jgi:hypothetical protein